MLCVVVYESCNLYSLMAARYMISINGLFISIITAPV